MTSRSRWIWLLVIACLAAGAKAEVIDSPEASLPLLAANAEPDTDAEVEPNALPGSSEEEASAETMQPLWAPLPEREDAPVADASPALQEMSATPRRFRYKVSVEVRGVADDNITLSHNNPEADYYGQISAELTAGFGDVSQPDENYLAFNYSPAGYLFQEHSEFNTLEHIARLQGQWRLSRLTLGLSQSVSSVQSANLNVPTENGGFANEVNLDIGGRRRVNSYATHLTAQYELTGKTSARAEADFSSQDAEGLIGSTSLSGGLGLDYTYGPKLQLGLLGRFGKNFVEGSSPDQTYEQATVRFSYQPSGKLKTNGSAGVQFQQSEEGDGGHVSPVFEAGLTYTPFDGTEIGVSATGRTFNSATAAGRDFSSTQFVFRARQRFLQRLYLSLATGFQNQSYFSTVNGAEADRDDNYFFVVPSIDYNITRFWAAGVYYVHSQNDSSAELFGFEHNQFGLRTALQF